MFVQVLNSQWLSEPQSKTRTPETCLLFSRLPDAFPADPNLLMMSSTEREPNGSDAGVSAERPPARNAFHLILGQAATTALAVILTGAIGRSLGPADFGSWYLLTTIAGFAYVFVDWGYSPYVIREVARRPDRAGELTGTVLVLRTLTALAIAGAAIVVTEILGSGPHISGLAGLNIAASMPMLLLSSFAWTFRGRERMDSEALINVVLKVFILAATIGLLATGMRLGGVILAQTIAGAAAFGIALSIYVRLSLPPLRVTRATARELIAGAAPMFTMGLMVSVQPYIDANVLSKLVPAEVVGWYGATAVFAGTLLAPALILGGTVYPRLSRAVANREEFTALVRSSMRPVLFVAMLGAIGTFAFADFAVSIVYHDRAFAPAATILRAFSLNLFLVSVDVLLGNIILAAGSVVRFARAKVGAVIVTTALEVVLIQICQTQFGNGGIGVMLAFAAGELILIVAAIRLIPAGTLDRTSLVDVGRALAAGAATVLTLQLVAPAGPLVGIAVTVAAYTLYAFGFRLLKTSDIHDLRALVTPKAKWNMTETGPAQPTRRGLRIGSLWVDAVTRGDALAAIERLVDSGRGGAVFTPNVDHVVIAESNPALRDAYARASLSVADGMPLVWASPFLGCRLPERVAGSDLFIPLMHIAARRGWRVYLVGGVPPVAQEAAYKLRTDYGVNVVGSSSPVVDRNGVEVYGDALESVRAARPDLVVVALGNPKQELWVTRGGEALGPAVSLGLGAVLDFLVGRQKRAPRWIASAGFEWLYRLAHDPRRLWRRYLVQDPRFAFIVLSTWWRARRHRLERSADVSPFAA